MQAPDPWKEKTDLRLAGAELDISALREQIAVLCRVVEINRTLQRAEATNPRTVSTERAHRHIASLAVAIQPHVGGIWKTALAVRMAITGEDPTPPGLEGTVAALRDHYHRGAPTQKRIWKILDDSRDFREIAAVAGAGR